MLKTVFVGLILIAMTGSGVLGDACSDQQKSCSSAIGNLTTRINALALNTSSPFSAFNQTCQNYDGMITACTDYLKTNCDANEALALRRLTTSLCQTDPECLAQLHQCQTNLSTGGQKKTRAGLCQKWESAKTCLKTELGSMCSLEHVVLTGTIRVVFNFFYNSACNPRAKIHCSEVLACMIYALSSPSSGELTCSSGVEQVLGCLADIKGECSVKNNGVTFKRVQEDAKDVCQVMKGEEMEVTSCPTMANCVTQTDFYKEVIDGVIGRSELYTIDTIMDSAAWCRYIKQLARCAVLSADTCSFSSNLKDNMIQKAEMMEIVCPHTAGGGMTLSKPSLWLLFVLGFALTPIFRELNIV